MEANKVVDSTVFVSNWLKELFLSRGLKDKNIEVGFGEQLKNIQFRRLHKVDSRKKLKIVTHHWGANLNKGFDTYNLLDKMLESNKWKNLIEFTYIGNLPKNLNSKMLKSLNL